MLLAAAALTPVFFLCTYIGRLSGIAFLLLLFLLLPLKERVPGLKLFLALVFLTNFVRIWILLPGGEIPEIHGQTELCLRQTLWHSHANGSCARIAFMPGIGRVCLQGEERLLTLDRVRGRVTLRRPEGAANPGSFDEAGWLRGYGVFYLADLDRAEVISYRTGVAWQLRDRILERIRAFYERELGKDEAAFLQALLFGEKSGLSRELKGSILLLGIAHITAVSGMHLIFLLAPFRISFVREHCKPKWLLLGRIFFMLLWNLLCAFPPGLVRASILLLLSETNAAFQLRLDRFSLLCLAAAGMAVWEPFSLLNRGFLWSYAAVTALFMFGPALARVMRARSRYISERMTDSFSSLIAAQSAMILLNGERFALLSPLLAFMQLPVAAICGLLFVTALPVAVLLGAGISSSVLRLLTFPTKLLSELWICWLKRVPHLPILRYPYVRGGAVFATGLIWQFLPLFPPVRRLFRGRERMFARTRIAALCVLLLFGSIQGYLSRPCEITFLSVGQGDSFVIRSGNEYVLYDSGSEEACLNVLLPYMMAEGIPEFKAAVLTHGHEDHLGGLLDLARFRRVEMICMPAATYLSAEQEDGGWERVRELLQICRYNGIKLKIIRENDTIHLDRERGFFLEFISGTSREDDPDQDCLIARLHCGAKSVLLTADMTRVREEEYIRTDGRAAHILKIAHHGSGTVTSDDFLRCTRPQAAILSVGKNSYGHPSGKVLERLAEAGITLFRTDLDGAVRLRFEEDGSCRICSWKSGRNVVLKP